MSDERDAGLFRDGIRNIVVTGRLFEELKPLAGLLPDYSFRFRSEDELTVADFDWADAYTAFRPTPHFRFGRIKWVHALGAGVDAFLSLNEWPSDVALTRTVGPFGGKIAEYCASHIWADLQRHAVFRRQQEQRNWLPQAPASIRGCRVVIFGTGAIGRETAELLHSLGAVVYGVSASGEAKRPFERVVRTQDAYELLGQAQWVVNTMPLTDTTSRFFGASLFSQLSGAGFINVGRGGSVDNEALLHALDSEYVRLAVLDVFEEEPLPESSRFWERPDVIVTPHISALTTAEDAIASFVETALQLRSGRVPEGWVDRGRGY